MGNTTDEFIRAFEKIKAEVNRRAADPNSRSFEIERASSRDGAVRKNRSLLIYMREVRNTLQHPQHHSAGAAVQITEPFLAETLKLLDYFQNPPTAGLVGVPRKTITTGRLTDTLGGLADEMKSGGFSHLPILDDGGAVIGVFNEAAVFDHLWSEPEIIVGRDMKVADIMRHCQLDAGHTETFQFVNPRTSLEDLVAMFLSVASKRTRVGAAFVTASGKSSEPLQRLITPWDVLASSAG